jgi:predicted P-loop ATPase
LFGDFHFSSNSDLGGERIAFEIQGKWCLEIGDMHAFNRSEMEAMKNFISRLSDHFRPPWGRFYIDAPRSLIIIGTANREELLHDETGETRFVTIKCGLKRKVVDLAGISRDRDQLFAEAFARRGESTLLSEEAEKQARQHQKDAKERDSWQPKIEDWLTKAALDKITTENILGNCLAIHDFAKHTLAEQRRVGRCMRELGYTRVGQHHRWVIDNDAD